MPRRSCRNCMFLLVLLVSAWPNEGSTNECDKIVERAVDLGGQGDMAGAWRGLEAALAKCPDHAVALGNVGYLHAISGQLEKAKDLLERALVQNPLLMQPWVNLGNIEKQLRDDVLEEARGEFTQVWRLYRTARRLSPEQMDVTANIAGLLAVEREWEHAAAAAAHSLRIHWTEEAFCALMKAADNICLWRHPSRDLPRLEALLASRAAEALRAPEGFSMHRMCYNAGTAALISDFPPALVLAMARAEMAVMARNTTALPPSLLRAALPADRRLTLAFVSGHFLNHPMMQMMQGMFRLHHPDRVQVACFATTPSDGSDLRAKAQSACHSFVEVHLLEDQEVAHEVNRAGAHILINLFGFLDKSRNAIAAFSPSPVSINHRWCSTTGAPFIHYHVTDRYTSPPDFSPFYSERLTFMPHSYLVNDHRASYPLPPRPPLPAPPRRAATEPPARVALASLNNLYKLTPELFATWMEILRRVPHATLALLEGRQGARTNARLRAEARLLGVDPHRLLTARPQSKDLHLLRSRDFHLFLDTWKVASHSTAVDSLWAEVPVVAWSQVKMQARVCGALLQVLGLPELLARSAKDYSDLVVALATSPRARARVGRRLTAALRESPLFDTQGWVLDAERMHRLMWEVHVAQGKSAHLVVAERPR